MMKFTAILALLAATLLPGYIPEIPCGGCYSTLLYDGEFLNCEGESNPPPTGVGITLTPVGLAQHGKCKASVSGTMCVEDYPCGLVNVTVTVTNNTGIDIFVDQFGQELRINNGTSQVCYLWYYVDTFYCGGCFEVLRIKIPCPGYDLWWRMYQECTPCVEQG